MLLRPRPKTMSEPQDLRDCPTRSDGSPTLMAHRIAKGTCQKLQRGMFHKCFSCAWLNSRVAEHGPPEAAAPEPAPTKRKAPATRLH